MKTQFRSFLLCCVLFLAAASLQAGTSVTHVGANPWFLSPGGTGNVASQDPVGATLEKTFIALGDIPFIVNGGPSSVGGVDFFHIDERVRNNTGVAWTDFHFLVESIDSNPALQVDFLNLANPTGQFTSSVEQPGLLSLFGNVPDGDIFSISFDLQISSPEGAYYLFGIHEIPTVPEPSLLGLLGLGFPALLAFGRRGKGAS